MYLAYMTMLLGFLALIVPIRTWNKIGAMRSLLFLGIALALGVLAYPALAGFDQGEMGFGNFTRFLPGLLPSVMLAVGLSLAALLLFFLGYQAAREGDAFAQFLLCTLVPYLVMASCTRPAQRYLLLCLPMVLFYLIVMLPVRRQVSLSLGWASVIAFATLSLAGTLHHIAQGRAADSMARWILTNGYAGNTELGVIRTHAGQYFAPHDVSQATYEVRLDSAGSPVHEEPVVVFGRRLKTFRLVPRDR
jgi:hypothetical protein